MKVKIAFAALALGIPVAGSAHAQDLGIGVGKKAPAAVVYSLDGKKVDLGSYVGKTPIQRPSREALVIPWTVGFQEP